MLTLGDFFVRAGTTRPVSPREVKFTAVCKDLDTLPGGTANVSKKQVAADVCGCLVFVGGEGLLQARMAARARLQERATVKDKAPIPSDDDFPIELHYQLIQRALREWDPAERLAGGPMFPSVKLLSEMVELATIEFLWDQYWAFVKEEHPEVLPKEPFRPAGEGSEGVAGVPPA
jgi:hypothetical protein